MLFVIINERKRTLIPHSLSTLIAMLKTNGISVRLFDTSFYEENARLVDEDKKEDAGVFKETDYSTIGVKVKHGLIKDFIDTIRSFQPELVGFSVDSYTFESAVKLSRIVKKHFGKSTKTIFGGIHVTLDYENIFKEKSIDFLCVGEGESALLDLCKRIEKGEMTTDIKNIWYEKNGRLVKTGLREPVDLDSLPIPDWEEFASYHQYGPWRGKLVKMVLAEFSRICPFACAYCGNRIMIDTYAAHGVRLKPRHKSPKKFVSDLKYLKDKFKIEMVAILDGTFLSFPDSVLAELAPLYKKEIGLPFYITTTASSITERRAALLKLMGCICVNIGVENGDFDYRKKIMNRPWSDRMLIRGFDTVKKFGMEGRAYNIIGAPHETRETIMKTIELNRKINPGSSSLAVYIPFPGSKMRDMCVADGLFGKNQKIVGDGTVPVIKSNALSNNEIIGLFKTFMLYLKAPLNMYPLIKIAEGNSPDAEKLRKELQKIFL